MPTADSLERTQTLVERAPLAFVAAFFALAFGALLVWHLRTLSRMYKEQRDLAERTVQAMQMLHAFPDLLTPLIYELQRKTGRRGGTNPGIRLSDLKGGGE